MMGEVRNKALAFVKRRVACVTARRMLREQGGATTVEFAMVAAPFLALVFAILETALVFFAGQVLETAASDSARLIMTGQAQKNGFNETKFKEEVCNRVFGLFDCNTGIKVDVRTYSSFSSANMSKPIDANGNVTFTPMFQPGTPGDIVVVRLLRDGTGEAPIPTVTGTGALTGADGNPVSFTLGGP